MTLQQRLWSRIDRSGPGGCWVWQGSRHPYGYGSIRSGKTSLYTHRVAYECRRGKIPEGMCVLHRGDNPACCNPGHLFLGTRKDNADDMIRKGRDSLSRPGDLNPKSILREAQVAVIKKRLRRGESPTCIVKDYVVCRQAIYDIKRGRNWKHVR